MKYEDIFKIYPHKEDKPLQEHDDMDLIREEAEERYNRHMQRRLAMSGDSEYPQHLAQQDIIEAEQERLRLLGIVDISEVKNEH